MSPSRASARRAAEPAPIGRRDPAGGREGDQRTATTGGWVGLLDVGSGVAQRWAPTVAGVVLGTVLAWFGYHELVAPGQWTGYVPVVAPASHPAQVLVLAHGWALLVLAVALVAGVAPRLAAALAALFLLEIVISLTVSGGLSDLVLRDFGVLGLAVALTGARRRHLVLRR